MIMEITSTLDQTVNFPPRNPHVSDFNIAHLVFIQWRTYWGKNKCKAYILWRIYPEPTARSAILGVSPGPRETKALAKSKVHQWSRALTNDVEWVVILTDLKNMADCL
jgi:hypothetical protein